MRGLRRLGPGLGLLAMVTAQEDCPATVTVTNFGSATLPPATSGSSSFSRQVITLTSYNTITLTSNGVEVQETQAVAKVLVVGEDPTPVTGFVKNRQATSCPPAVTVTLISQQTESTVVPTTLSSTSESQTTTSSSILQISSSVSTETGSSEQTSSTALSVQSTSASSSSQMASPSSTVSTTSTTESSSMTSTTSRTVSSSSSSSLTSTTTTEQSESASQSLPTIPSSSSGSSLTSGSLSSPLSTPISSQSPSQSSTSTPSSRSTQSTSHSSQSSSESTPSTSSVPRSSNESPSITQAPPSHSESTTRSRTSSLAPPSSSSTRSIGTNASSQSSRSPQSAQTSPSPSNPPAPPTGSTTGPPSSTLQSVTVRSGIDPSLWTSPSPTITCKPPCNLDLPCMTLKTPTTVSPPPYTTSLCKQHCDGIDFRTMTTISFPAITASQVCFYPMQAEAADVFTAAPNWFGGNNGLINITAPASLSTCPPHWPDSDPDGKCGPDNHYLCPKKKCCGKDNKCGEGIDYCGDGCQLNWGYCWKNSTTCKMPKFGKKDDDDDHLVPIFPIWFDAPDPPGPPPPINIISGDITFPPPPDLCSIVGCKGICGWISCEGIAGWFIKMIRIPKLKCNIITKTFCRLLNLPCCKKKGGGGGGGGSSDCEFCDPPGGSTLNGDSKVCDPGMENCDDLPEEEEEDEDECTTTSTATDKTVYCDLTTATDGKSSQTCTSTGSKVRSGCTLSPASTETVTSKECKTTTVNQISELCQVITGASTTRTQCPTKITKKASGCHVTPTTTSIFTTSCKESTATHISEICSVATAANSTSTYCRSTRTSKVSGCDVTGSRTSVFSTDCFSRTTVTDKTASCFAIGSTVVAGSTIIPSTTCTETASTVYSGCELTGSTTSEVSTSFPACAASAQISLEPMPTFASNLTESAPSTCGPPTSSGLPECTKIVVGQYVVTEAIGDISGTGVTARAEGDATASSISCYCGPSAGADVWPVTVCKSYTWCPNEPTTTREVTGTPAPPTLPATWS